MPEMNTAGTTTDLRPFSDLTGAEIIEGLDALKAHGLPINQLHSLGRIAFREFVFAIRIPVNPLQDRERPWIGTGGASFKVEWHGLASAVAELQKEGNSDNEVQRRLDLCAAQSARDQQNLEEARKRQQENAAVEAEARRLDEEARAKYAGDQWDRTNPIAQAIYLQALACEDLGHGELAERFRGIAMHLGNQHVATARPFPFPGKRWR